MDDRELSRCDTKLYFVAKNTLGHRNIRIRIKWYLDLSLLAGHMDHGLNLIICRRLSSQFNLFVQKKLDIKTIPIYKSRNSNVGHRATGIRQITSRTINSYPSYEAYFFQHYALKSGIDMYFYTQQRMRRLTHMLNKGFKIDNEYIDGTVWHIRCVRIYMFINIRVI